MKCAMRAVNHGGLGVYQTAFFLTLEWQEFVDWRDQRRVCQAREELASEVNVALEVGIALGRWFYESREENRAGARNAITE